MHRCEVVARPVIKGKVWDVFQAYGGKKMFRVQKRRGGDFSYKLNGWTRWSNGHASRKVAIAKALDRF